MAAKWMSKSPIGHANAAVLLFKTCTLFMSDLGFLSYETLKHLLHPSSHLPPATMPAGMSGLSVRRCRPRWQWPCAVPSIPLVGAGMSVCQARSASVAAAGTPTGRRPSRQSACTCCAASTRSAPFGGRRKDRPANSAR
jgi:hypothetical protein